MSMANYLRRQAAKCRSLSTGTFDLVIAARLRALADELEQKAKEIEVEELAGACDPPSK